MSSLDETQLRELYRYLCLTRAVEERLEKLFKQGHIVGGLYRSLGQEATAVGSAYALEEGDWLAPAIRDLGALLVRGVEPEEIFLQYTARRDSLTGGKDNTNHFTVPELGILGPVSPLGTQLCVLGGVALAIRRGGEDRVCMVYQGEGATRTGASHEGMNFAAVQRLPLVVVLEHNRWSFSTRSDREGAVEAWTDVAKAYGAPALHVDGNDLLQVCDAARDAVERARRGEGVTFVVAETYRMLGHAQHDPQPYVPEEELEEWRRRDPIRRHRSYLLESGFADEASLAAIEEEVKGRVERAADEALESPFPSPEEARSRILGGETDGAAPVPWTRRRPVGYDEIPLGIRAASPVDPPGEGMGAAESD